MNTASFCHTCRMGTNFPKKTVQDFFLRKNMIDSTFSTGPFDSVASIRKPGWKLHSSISGREIKPFRDNPLLPLVINQPTSSFQRKITMSPRATVLAEQETQVNKGLGENFSRKRKIWDLMPWTFNLVLLGNEMNVWKLISNPTEAMNEYMYSKSIKIMKVTVDKKQSMHLVQNFLDCQS